MNYYNEKNDYNQDEQFNEYNQNNEYNNVNDDDDDNIMYYDNGNNISLGIKEVDSPYKKYGGMTFNKVQNNNQINYDDILNYLNVRIQNGKLEKINPNNTINNGPFKAYPQQQQYSYNQTNNSNIRPYQSPVPIKKIETKPVSLKNDSFYKYFKSHNLAGYNPNQINEENEENIADSMTKEEYAMYRYKKFIENENKRRMIQQAKSKNMRFTNGNGMDVNIQRNNVGGNLNKLFHFSKK